MKFVHDIVRKPVISEKSMIGAAKKIYTFEVAYGSSKTEIKHAVEEIFGVEVDTVNTLNYYGKEKRMGATSGTRAKRKKAVVKLTEKSKPIEFFEGMM